MALKTELECDIDLQHENSLDNSGDSELLGMVDGPPFGINEGRHHLATHNYLDTNDDETYTFKDLQGGITYKIVQMPGEQTLNDVSPNSPPNRMNAEYYVIGEPVDSFGESTAQKKAIRKNPLQAKAVTAKKRDDKRRATHNEVERRRRDKINSWISKLAALVPNSGLPDTASKGGILAKACDHITDLTDNQKRLEVENERLVSEIMRLGQELTKLRKENSSLKSQLDGTCIVQRPKGQRS